MHISLIAALDNRRGIGRDNQLPWRLSADLKRFRELTMGHHLIVGRKTYESIGKPLPGRQMIVISRNAEFSAPGCLVVSSLEDALTLAETRGETEVFVIGGAQIYEQALPLATRLYLTRVAAEVAADTYFPPVEESLWEKQSEAQQPADDKNEYPFTFQLFVKPQR